jgi:hypothetical protein
MKKFKISYYFSDSGMEGREDIFPEKIIEAKTKELAAFIYYLMFFAEIELDKIEHIRSYGGHSFSMTSFEEFLKDDNKYFGLSIEEIY